MDNEFNNQQNSNDESQKNEENTSGFNSSQSNESQNSEFNTADTNQNSVSGDASQPESSQYTQSGGDAPQPESSQYTQYGSNSEQPYNNQYSQYGGNAQYKWNYDDYQKALNEQKKSEEKPPKRRRGLKPLIVTISSIAAVAIIGFAIIGVSTFTGWNRSFNTSSTSNGANLVLNSQPTTSSQSVSSGSEMTAEQVASKLTPSVVGVEIYSLQSVEPTAEGSGIVMTSDGYIITNAHVIEGYQKIRIVMSNNKTYDNVQVVGQDTKTDLAVLKVNAVGLTAAVFGDSSQLKVGQSVIAIGNPGGLTLASSVTNGIISGLNRTVSSTKSMTYIQTNALINPGNSGGPLVNMYGQVVGINTAKIAETGYEGIGFAIPISTAKPIVDSIIKNGYVTGRVKVGISVYPLSNSQAKWYNYPSGLYVENIDSSSDAYSKGLHAKDIITKINNVSLASDDSNTVYNTFYSEETKYKVGDTITLSVYRTDSGKTVDISVKLEEDKGDSSTTTSSSSNQSENNESQGQNDNSDTSNFFNW